MAQSLLDRKQTEVVLNQAANFAGYAPSIHNSQPWRWRMLPHGMQLWAVPERHLVATDPDRRMLTISCGAALHHALVALRAVGWTVDVHRLPDPDQPDLLAELGSLRPHPATDGERAMLRALTRRWTDRRPVPGEAVPLPALTSTMAAMSGHAVWLKLLAGDQVVEFAGIADFASFVQDHDPTIRAELREWTSRYQMPGLGIPATARPDHQTHTVVPGRDFGAPGTLPTGGGHDHTAWYGLLCATADDPIHWLTAGEALSSGWLTAVDVGLSLVPLSWMVETAATRAMLRQSLCEGAQPMLAVRIGCAHRVEPTDYTPRLPVVQLIERPPDPV